jgi:hypothetical protein
MFLFGWRMPAAIVTLVNVACLSLKSPEDGYRSDIDSLGALYEKCRETNSASVLHHEKDQHMEGCPMQTLMYNSCNLPADSAPATGPVDSLSDTSALVAEVSTSRRVAEDRNIYSAQL